MKKFKVSIKVLSEVYGDLAFFIAIAEVDRRIVEGNEIFSVEDVAIFRREMQTSVTNKPFDKRLLAYPLELPEEITSKYPKVSITTR